LIAAKRRFHVLFGGCVAVHPPIRLFDALHSNFEDAMLRLKLLVAILAVMVSDFPAQAYAQPSPAGDALTIEQLIDVKHPSSPVWSPDGGLVAFIWDRAGVSNIYVSNLDGRAQPTAVTSYADGHIRGLFFSHDGHTIYFVRHDDLSQVAATGGHPRPVWSTPLGGGDFVPSPDRSRVALVRQDSEKHGTDLVIRSLTEGSETKIAHDDVNIENAIWSPDGSHVGYIGGAKTIPHDSSPSYSGEKLVYRNPEYVPGVLFAVPSTGGEPVAIGTKGDYDAVSWIDSTRIVFARQSNQYKTRTVYVASIKEGTPKAIHSDDEEKFWSLPDWEAGTEPLPSPDGRWIAFLSDQDGWDHIYVIPSTGGTPVQITKGRFEAWRLAWSHDSMRIAFDANEPDRPGDRRVGIASIGTDPAHATVTYITQGRGTNIEPSWSPNDKSLVYQHTDTRNSADLFVIDATSAAKPIRLGDSMPTGMDRSVFVEPEFVHYLGPDGQFVPAWLFVPKNLDRTKKHPAIVWIHGDGINQNYDGWHVQRNYAVYYSMHQYLLQQGYVVISPDYRGSIGYGRDWRNGVYMDVGGNDAKDAWMAANFLKSLPYVDSNRMGIWGLSYGGFFTLIAMTDQPTLFRAGIDVAGVVDYEMYYNDPYHGDWTESRIGTPRQNPKVYANASPISHIDRLADPLLILHGTADVNVPFIESVWLLDEALKKQKGDLLTFMMYPGEFHYFTREHVLRDAWHRIDDYFATHLHPENR
jgi:dipeptidyl aminopeptidase/acylaminoacyl peptidase